jgi:hypothetical protein
LKLNIRFFEQKPLNSFVKNVIRENRIRRGHIREAAWDCAEASEPPGLTGKPVNLPVFVKKSMDNDTA